MTDITKMETIINDVNEFHTFLREMKEHWHSSPALVTKDFDADALESWLIENTEDSFYWDRFLSTSPYIWFKKQEDKVLYELTFRE